MALRTRIDPIEKDILATLAPELTSAGRSAALAEFARDAIEEAQAQDRQAFGRALPYETFVDGRRTGALESVKPDGVIVVEFDFATDLFQWIEAMLVRHSPVRTGRYQRSHVFLADGVRTDPSAPPPGMREGVFLSTVPYARRLERGHSRQAPDGIYQVVAVMAARRSGRLARVDFGYRTPSFGDIDRYARTAALAGRGRGQSYVARREWLARQPAIIVMLR